MNGPGSEVAVVVIGRNEGRRLERCLKTVTQQSDRVVYVDSGSTDNSVAFAGSLGIEVVELDMSIPFSAGRARNAGFLHVCRSFPGTRFVQFLDGDCELAGGWLEKGHAFLEQHSEAAIVAGRVREHWPEKSVYNRICDLEWQTAAGRVAGCGGIFMVRVPVFQELGGFNPSVVAGEEPEFCYRLRQQGWVIYRIDQVMALHDADMTRFSQWWRRAVRGGYAYAHCCRLHGLEPERFRVRECARIWFWGAVLPVAAILLSCLISPVWSLLSALYPVQVARAFFRLAGRGLDGKTRGVIALLSVVEKWPQWQGQVRFIWQSATGQLPVIIEYK